MAGSSVTLRRAMASKMAIHTDRQAMHKELQE
jgi:hypothetical protein